MRQSQQTQASFSRHQEGGPMRFGSSSLSTLARRLRRGLAAALEPVEVPRPRVSSPTATGTVYQARTDETHRDRLASLGRMSAVLAHEIRNPLGSLKGHAQLLQESLEPGSLAQKRAARVVQETVRLELLVLQLLEFVRSGQVERVPVDLAGFIHETLVEEDNARVYFIGFDTPEVLPVDPLRLRQVLTNLIRNALEASPEDGPVEVELRGDENKVRIFVRDRGPGIPAGQEEAIFEPFHTNRVRGVGLGLAVSRQIVELHQGTLFARNRFDGGAEFCICLLRT